MQFQLHDILKTVEPMGQLVGITWPTQPHPPLHQQFQTPCLGLYLTSATSSMQLFVPLYYLLDRILPHPYILRTSCLSFKVSRFTICQQDSLFISGIFYFASWIRSSYLKSGQSHKLGMIGQFAHCTQKVQTARGHIGSKIPTPMATSQLSAPFNLNQP